MAQEALVAFSLGLAFFIGVKIVVSSFYAQKDMKTPFKVATLALVINVILNAVLIGPLAHVGLALATSLTAGVNFVVLLTILIRRRQFLLSPKLGCLTLKVIVALGAMAIVLFFVKAPQIQWLQWPMWVRLVHLLMLIALGMVVYGLVLWLLRVSFRQCLVAGELS